ncbi:hypothetical protein [Gloeothece verrucosa]|uniref:hypothetical protein n=1 Tax=Gloeothece verrucosa TaxID=2546359 RepID=UPI00017E2BE8|nr:hypothetical protein [Gloeothece verrucosa]
MSGCEQKLKDITAEFNTQFGVFVKAIVKDLSCANAPEEIFQELQQEAIKVDILVNEGFLAIFNPLNIGTISLWLNLSVFL